MGLASNRAQGKQLSGLTDERWASLTSKERRRYIRAAAVARGDLGPIAHAQATPGMNKARYEALNAAQQEALVTKTMRELPARRAAGMTDQRWYNELSEAEREELIHDAAVAGGDASVQADGRKAAKLGKSEWRALPHPQRMAFLRKTNLTRLTAAHASIQNRALDRMTVIDEMYKATVSTYVDTVLELDPHVLGFSSSPTLRRSAVRAALTSNRKGQTKAAFNPKHHLMMQGGRHPDSTDRSPTGTYGKDHFPVIDEFPQGSTMTLSDVATEFAYRNTNLALNTEEEIAWLYHRIRALLKRFIQLPAASKKYEDSAHGKAVRKQSRPLARSMMPQENVGSTGGATR